MSAPLGSIRNWSNTQLAEDVNNEDGVSTTKYNERWRRAKACKEEAERRAHEEAERHQAEEQRRVEAERHKAEEQAKRRVSGLWLVMMELMVVDRGGCCITVRQGQGEGIGVAGLPMVCGAQARVQTQAW